MIEIFAPHLTHFNPTIWSRCYQNILQLKMGLEGSEQFIEVRSVIEVHV